MNSEDSKVPAVLIVDDEEDLCEILSEELEDAGFRTFTANSGKSALKVIEGHKIDLVVSDINMPDGNGVFLLDQVKEKDPETPVVLFITGYSDLSIEDAYDKGAEAVFSKPVDIDALVEVVRTSLTPKEQRWGRTKERFDIRLTVELSFEGFESARKASTLNLGRGGMFLMFESNFPDVDDHLQFKIVFEDGVWSPINGLGIVRWVRTNSPEGLPSGVGIEFTHLGENTIKRLSSLVNAIKVKSFIPKT